MFGKRNVPPKAEPATPVDIAATPAPATPEVGASATVIVRKSAVEAARSGGNPQDLIQAVVDFVNAMSDQGLYRRDELVETALQAYHADYYLAQVNNGGHSQFIGNSGSNAEFAWPDASAALRAMGSDSHAGLLDKMNTWAQANPEEAAGQTGFDGGRAACLDELDKAFYELEKTNPLSRASAQWILNWPELQIVEDSDYADAMNHLILTNPLREDRLVESRIASFVHQMNDWLHVSVGMAATSCENMDIRLGLGGGAIETIEGEQQMAWRVQTNLGKRFAVVTDQWTRLYEMIEADNPEIPPISDTEGFMEAMRDGRVDQFKPPIAGERLAHVEAETIAEIIRHGNRNRAAAAIDLLLRQIGYTGNAQLSAVSAAADQNGKYVVIWIAATEDEAFIAHTHEVGAYLARFGQEEPLAKLPAAIIAQHAGKYGNG